MNKTVGTLKKTHKIGAFIDPTLDFQPDWIIRAGTIIFDGSKIGKNLETGYNVVIREDCSIGNNVKIWTNSVIDYGTILGDNVKIHCNCYIAQYTRIGDNVFLAPGVTTLNDLHPGCKHSKECMRGPIIEDGAQIGGNSTILPYVKIGKNSVIGGGSVVTKDIPANSLAYGSPARFAKSIFDLKCKTRICDKPYEIKVDAKDKKVK